MELNEIKEWQDLLKYVEEAKINAKTTEEWETLLKTVIDSVNQLGEKNGQLASETIKQTTRASKAKNFAIVALVIGMFATAVGMATVNYKNDKDWRDFISQYDFVTQDGEGTNSFIGGDGDVINH